MDDVADVLRAASLDLTHSLDLDEVLEKLLGHLSRLVPYDTANVMLLEGEDLVAVRAIRGYDSWTGDTDVVRRSTFQVATHPIFATMIRSATSVLVPDTTTHPDWQHHDGSDHVRSFIGVPLLAAGRVIGLYGVDKAQPGFFDQEHVRRTESLAPHAAIAIRNARLFEDLQRSEERFRALVEHSSEGMWLLDSQGTTVWGTRSSQDVLGEAIEDIVGRSVFVRVHPDDKDDVQREFARCLANPGTVIEAQIRLLRKDGEVRTVRAIGVNRLADPRVGAIVVNYHDVTGVLESERRVQALNRDLQRQLAEFKTLLDVIPIGIGIARDRDCNSIQANRFLARMMGVSVERNASLSAPEDERPPDVQFLRDGRPLPPDELPMQKAAAEGVEVLDVEMDLVRDGRRLATVLGAAAPLFDETGQPRGAIGTAIDISERKRAEEDVRRLAYNDALTGLPNRLLFRDHLDLAVAHAQRSAGGLAVLFLDVDRFKVINDSLGHSVGDRLIRGVGERLRGAVRHEDTVARLGGDEFTLLLPDVAEPVAAARVAEKVLAALRLPFTLDGNELFVTASMGISLYPGDGGDAETLVKNADIAMYRAKDQGRDGYMLFTPAMNASAAERLALENRLRRALPQGELELHYQPLIELADGSVYGVEALLRWRHPEHGVVPPADFIPLAEATGLILPMGPWVLETACTQAHAWQQQDLGALSVAVNLSARQFQQPGLSALVRHVLKTTRLAPHRLQIEITESSAMANAASAAETLAELRALGVRVAIDDFGTGYSSLAYLKRFAIDTLKIDQAFVRDLPREAGIATAVIAMARTLKLDVVAEGVETWAQLEFLREHGCSRVQGELFSMPLPAADCAAYLSAHRKR